MNIREIAKRARVSHSTVSASSIRLNCRSQTGAPRAGHHSEVGYRPNFQARALARGRSRTVGLIVSELSGGNPFFL